MTKRQTPPTRKSKACVVRVKPSGPHHCARCSGSEKAANTRSRGALNTREPMIERGSRSRSMLFVAATAFLLGFGWSGLFAVRRFRLDRLQIILEAIEPLLPEAA